MATNRIVIESGEASVREYIEGCKNGGQSFLPQHRVHAAKDAFHLRRTVKLDPVAEYFIYDLVFRNRSLFRRPHHDDKRHYGYRFKNGVPSAPSEDYKEFKQAVWEDEALDAAFVGFDISTYFNNLYHHDLEAWLAALQASTEDVALFSKFLRETNAGRSVDCLPHGLYPTKMIGNDFLRFVEESMSLRATSIRRFMDDIYIFGDSKDNVHADFAHIQKLLGLKGLNVNAGKTTTDRPKTEQTEERISNIKKRLLQRRRELMVRSFYEDDDDPNASMNNLDLNSEELSAIHAILNESNLEEEDAELVLTVMRTHTADVISKLPEIINRFPHLAKNVYKFCFDIQDKETVSHILIATLKAKSGLQEYQLFWFGVMLESYLLDTKSASMLMNMLLTHNNATDISRAKVLEIPDHRFGLPGLRQEYLSSGRSDWLSWSSAVGSRSVKSAARNYTLAYFMKSSPINNLIGQIIQKL